MERDLRREIYEKAKRFEERVAELFALQGFRTIVDYQRDAMQFDIHLEIASGALPIYALVECKDRGKTVTQRQVREFAHNVEEARNTEKKPYQAIIVSRSGFANNAHVTAKNKFVRLLTFQQLLLSLVDLGPNLEAAIRHFEGTPLERLYVEQEAVLEANIRPGEPLEPTGLTETVRSWLDRPGSTFLALLGDFGCGKTSFCKRIAWELATESKENPGEIRMPVLIDLREGGSTTVTLENLLTHHFQRLSSQAFNPQALLHLNREGYLLLIFDGFDETIAYTEPGRYVENLRQILRAAEGKAKVLLTCRTHYFRDRPEVLKRLGRAPEMVSSPGATKLYEELQERAGAEVGYVLEFREPQIEQYLQKALPASADWRAFREQIRHTFNLEELAERPFLLEIIVKTLPRLLERGSAVTLADLYETYCESWFAHTDFRLTLTRDNKVELVEYLACLIWNSPENRVHYTVLADKAAEFFKDRLLAAYDKERIDYEVRTALFLHRDAEGYYSFIHRSFLEFFIARTLRAGLAAENSGCLSLRKLTREVVFFLGFWPEAKRIPRLAGRVLEASYEPGVSENALLLLYFHARATLGPLVNPGAEAEPDLAQIRKAFAEIRPKVLNLPGADLEGVPIPGIDLHEAVLERANLSRANLRQAVLDGARLNGAVLAFVDLRRCSAGRADLSRADLNHLDAQDAWFREANLTEADLRFARFTRADLSQATVTGVRIEGTGFLQASLPRAISMPRTGGCSRAEDLGFRFQAGHSSAVPSVSWHPNGTVLATASWDGTLKLWDAGSGRLLNTLQGHNDVVTSVAWAPDGRRLASASYDKTVRIWDSEAGRLLNTLQGHEAGVNSVAWAPDGRRLASASSDQTVRLWNFETKRLLKTLQGHEARVNSVAWAPDGRRLASASDDQTVQLWTPETGGILNTLQGQEAGVNSVAWAPDGRRLASASDDKTVRLWDPEGGRLVSTLQGHEGGVNSVAWAPDGRRLTSASDDQTVRLWDPEAGRLLNVFHGHDHWVTSMAWAPDGRRIASASNDKTVRFWDPEFGSSLNILQEHNKSVTSMAWAPDGRRLASASNDKTVRLWDIESIRLLSTFQGHAQAATSLAWAPDGQQLASASLDTTVCIWDIASGKISYTLQGHAPGFTSVAWAPDGRKLALTLSRDKTVQLWDIDSKSLNGILVGHRYWVSSVDWAPDRPQLASASHDRTVQIWNTNSGKLHNILRGHELRVYSVAWAPDGRKLASASDDKTVRLWDPESGRPLKTLQGHDSEVYSVAWAPDGRRLASASGDRTVRLWDPESGRLLNTLQGHEDRVSSVAWSPDGRRLLASLHNLGVMVVWDVEANPPRILGSLYHTPGGSGFAMTPDGYVSGPPEALEYVRFGDGWALYDLTDVPERLSPERVAAALNPERPGESRSKGRKAGSK